MADPSGKQPLPHLVRPMLATSGELPLPRDDQGWAYEMKWDGVRAVVYVDGGVGARVLTRNDRDVSSTYPELAELVGALAGHRAVLDGEVVAFDAAGRPDFGLLQQRMHVTNQAQVRTLVGQVPVHYLAFDLLHLDGHDTLDLAYEARRDLLDSLGIATPHAVVPPVFLGDGRAALAASQAQHLEGVVAKRRTSTYQPGRRSPSWLKVKNFRTQEVVIGGWRPGKGGRTGEIGSLLVGVPGPDGLEYVGHVGTGFTQSALRDLMRLLEPHVGPARPSRSRSPPLTLVMRCGSRPASSARCPSPSGRRTAGCVIPAGAACATTSRRPMSCARASTDRLPRRAVF